MASLDAMDVSLSRHCDLVKDREACASVHGVRKRVRQRVAEMRSDEAHPRYGRQSALSQRLLI